MRKIATIFGGVIVVMACGVALLSSTPERDLVAVMLGDVEAAASGKQRLAVRTSSVEELQRYYGRTGEIDFVESSVGNFAREGFRLVGGGVASAGSVRTTLNLYESDHGVIVGRRLREGPIHVPESSERVGDRSIVTVKGVSVGITRLGGGLLCALASKMPRELFVQHLEARHRPHGRALGPGVGPLL